MLLNATFQLFVVHPTRSLATLENGRDRLSATVRRVDFGRSILEQIDDRYDLLVLDWGLDTPDARGVLDAFRQRAPETQVLVLADDVPGDDPVDRGADELLVGPFSDETLHSTVERLLVQRAYEEATSDLFRLSTERALLESELQAGLDVADRYRTVVRDLYESRRRAATIRDELSSDEFEHALRRLFDE